LFKRFLLSISNTNTSYEARSSMDILFFLKLVNTPLKTLYAYPESFVWEGV
jgi:hypothetical protein